MRKEIKVYEWNENTNEYEWIIGHNAYVNGQMADGRRTWTFDEENEDGLYIGYRDEHNKIYLVRQ